jgi:alkylhydroperoxidase/carboxymuconolactone decarboxylase family protein YurZ/quercetin dioxygenase-like cupin family protein
MKTLKIIVIAWAGIFAALFSNELNAQDMKPIKLNAPNRERGVSTMQAFDDRHSEREFSKEKLSLQDLSDLLWAANGINRPNGRRTAATARNYQDINVYAIMEEGAYLYDAKAHELQPVAKGDHRLLVAGKQEQAWVADAPVSLLIVSDLSRFSDADIESPEVWGALDAGIVSQNIMLFASGCGFVTVPRISMKKDGLKKVLKLSDTQMPMLNNPVGYPKNVSQTKKQTAGRDNLGDFAPKFAELNDDVLFGQVWSCEQELSAKHRSMITVSALISGGNFEQLTSHLKKAKENGITKTEISEIITHLAFYTGWPKAWSAFNIAKEIYKDGNDLSVRNENLKNGNIFPLGTKVGQNFIGDAWLYMVFTDAKLLNAPIGSVTFAPQARNNWHKHAVGQVLLVTEGEGWYQEWGKPARLLKAGDVVNIPANVKHWHGATKDSWFVHLAITPGATEWLEAVTEEEYNNLLKQ